MSATELTEGVRRSIEDARDVAERNIDYIGRQIDKENSIIRSAEARIVSLRAELDESVATRDQAIALVGAAVGGENTKP